MGIIKRLSPPPAAPIVEAKPVRRSYSAARGGRLTAGWSVATTSADAELRNDLARLRDRSRDLVRNAPYAKRAKVIVVTNVIGPGIGLQAQVYNTRDSLNERVNLAIEEAFAEWSYAENCHTGGVLCFSDLERAAMGQVFEAGEVFIRKHYRPFGQSKVPFALELVEPERLPDAIMPTEVSPGNTVRMGVEIDRYQRPIAYYIRRLHPGDTSFNMDSMPDRWERVPAEQIFHLKVTDRWPQARGEPWLHAVAGRLNDMNGYAEAEIVAARGAASYMGSVETPDPTSPLVETETSESASVTQLDPGTVLHLAPGEKFDLHAPSRPNTAMDPFMRMMLREVAAGACSSYESLSRDYSQTTYSSGRMALVEDRDIWRTLQRWFVRSFREPLHREWLMRAVYSGAIPAIPVAQYVADPAKFEYARFKPRGWSWIDPEKEVDAYIKGIRAGLTTLTDVIAQTGNGDDVEDMLERRARELKLIDEIEKKYGIELSFDTDPEKNAKGDPAEPELVEKKPVPKAPPGAEADDDEPAAERVFRFRR